MTEIMDLVAALTAERDQFEAEFGAALGLNHGVPLDSVLLVAPDIGMRMTRDGQIPDRVRISWLLEPGTAFLIDPKVFA